MRDTEMQCITRVKMQQKIEGERSWRFHCYWRLLACPSPLFSPPIINHLHQPCLPPIFHCPHSLHFISFRLICCNCYSASFFFIRRKICFPISCCMTRFFFSCK